MTASKFPSAPTSWFYFDASSKLAVGQKKLFKILDQEIIIYRNEDHSVSAVSRYCPHMNADLIIGKNINNQLQCAFHCWSFDKNGFCNNIPNLKKENIPDWANLSKYSVKEVLGHIFIYNGSSPKFDLPFFANEDHSSFISSKAYRVFTNNDWFIGPANAFDLSHFISVHKRRPTAEPLVSKPNPNSYRIELEYEIFSNDIADKLLVAFYGSKGALDFTVYAGNFILAITKVKNFKNYMMIINRPVGVEKSDADVIVFRKKTLNPFKKLKLQIQAKLSQRFFQAEANAFFQIKFSPERTTESDSVLKEYFSWLANYYKN